MRISTTSIYEMGVARITEMQSSLVKTQQQIATGRRILTPADDPVAAARSLQLGQGQSINTQFATNRVAAKSALSLEESTLQSATTLLQDVKTLTVAAGNGAYSPTELKFIAAEVRNHFDDLMGLANTRDGNGNYMFSGFSITQQPYSKVAVGANYAGDQGQRLVQVASGRKMATNDPGPNVFDQIKTGNATFVTAPGASNTGSAVVSLGSVVDASALTGGKYEVRFSVSGNTTTYVVMNTTVSPAVPVPASPAVPVPIPYTSGQTISFDGLQFDVKGAPANGDVVTVEPSKNQSVFVTLDKLITALESAGSGDAGNAKLNNDLISANSNIDNALENMLAVRASIGARLKELDTLDSSGEERNLQYEQTLNDLTGLDFPKAITELSQQQTTLEAAQKSFMSISKLSLFNLL